MRAQGYDQGEAPLVHATNRNSLSLSLSQNPKENLKLEKLWLKLLTTSQRLSFRLLTIPDPLQEAIIIEPHALTLMDIGIWKVSSSSKSVHIVKVKEVVMNQIAKGKGDVNLGLHVDAFPC